MRGASRPLWQAATAELFLCMCVGCSSEPVPPMEWVALLAPHPCSGEATKALLAWGARDEVLRAPPAPGFAGSFRIPTAVLGEWVLIDAVGAGTPTISLVRGEGAEQVTFSDQCVASVRSVASARPAVSAGRALFTDEDLRSALSSSAAASATVIYVWSPHMSLSIDGYPEISAATDALGLALIPVLFPQGDHGFAEREAAQKGMPVEALREAASVELAFRDALVHAPSIVVFAGPRISPVLPGYRSAAGYQRFLEDFLAGR